MRVKMAVDEIRRPAAFFLEKFILGRNLPPDRLGPDLTQKSLPQKNSKGREPLCCIFQRRQGCIRETKMQADVHIRLMLKQWF